MVISAKGNKQNAISTESSCRAISTFKLTCCEAAAGYRAPKQDLRLWVAQVEQPSLRQDLQKWKRAVELSRAKVD